MKCVSMARLAALALAVSGAGLAQNVSGQAVPRYVVLALADPARPADEVARDAYRKPAEIIAFAGLRPGDRVGDFISGNGYFTRIFSRVVGPNGRVYAFTPVEEIRNCAPGETARMHAIAADPHYGNVRIDFGPVNDFAAPESLDMVWTAQNFHDLYDPFLGPADIAKVTAAIFRALKPGGVFMVIDHVAEAGSGVRDTNSLHRIDPDIIRKAVRAAGFSFAAESGVLRNQSDQHRLRVFDPAIRGRTDQVIFKFTKPAPAASKT